MVNFKSFKYAKQQTKKKIKEEEFYRYTIKTQLEKQNFKKENKYLRFLNSNFGLFLVGSIFVSFLTWSYTNFSEKIRIETENNEKVKRIKVEVFNRLKVLNCLLDTCDETNVAELKGSIYGHFGVIHYYNVYEEYKTSNLRSLIIEANSLIPGTYNENQLESIRRIFGAVKDLQKNSFYKTYKENYGAGGSGSLTVIMHKLPLTTAKNYLNLVSQNFSE